MPPKPRIYALDWKTPTSFGAWGASEEDRARLMWAMAQKVDPNPYWIYLVDPAGTRSIAQLPVVSRVPSNHLFVVDASVLAPQTEFANITSWLAREDIDEDRRLQTLADFVRLPALPRDLVKEQGTDTPTKALVIAESHRAAHLYPAEPVGIRPFIEAMNEYSTTVLFASGPFEAANARHVDYVFHLDHAAGRSTVSAECEQGAPQGAAGLFHTGYRRELDALIREIEGS